LKERHGGKLAIFYENTRINAVGLIEDKRLYRIGHAIKGILSFV
jgi:hypothetical protein